MKYKIVTRIKNIHTKVCFSNGKYDIKILFFQQVRPLETAFNKKAPDV